MRLEAKELWVSHNNNINANHRVWVDVKISERKFQAMIDSSVSGNFIHQTVIQQIDLSAESRSLYQLVMIRKQYKSETYW